MNPTRLGLLAGWRRGVIELRQSFSNAEDLLNHLLWPVLMLGVLFFLRDNAFGDSGFLLGQLLLPSILGMNVALSMLTVSQYLTVEREDGTLLRVKAVPHGMAGYLVGKLVFVSSGLIIDLAILLVPGMLVVGGLAVGSLGAWLNVLWVLALGMLAVLPIGAMLGSVFASPRSMQSVMLPILGLVGISGIFYPITSLPDWLQWIAQMFPVYWLGLGMRSALLPGDAVAVEIGESWRVLETVGVLGAWAVLGAALAPIVLRRMARRESGSSVARRRERALQRVG